MSCSIVCVCRCNTLLRLHGEIHSITPLARKTCDECGLRIATFEFNKLKSPLPDGATTYTGCIACDDLLNGLTELVTGRTTNLKLVRQNRFKRGGGRGRGRGRGRRGGRGGNVLMSFSDF
jgi:DNA topoisomerase-3